MFENHFDDILVFQERGVSLQVIKSGESIAQNTAVSVSVLGSCVVRDLEHVHKLHAREPGGSTFGLIVRSAL